MLPPSAARPTMPVARIRLATNADASLNKAFIDGVLSVVAAIIARATRPRKRSCPGAARRRKRRRKAAQLIGAARPRTQRRAAYHRHDGLPRQQMIAVSPAQTKRRAVVQHDLKVAVWRGSDLGEPVDVDNGRPMDS